MNILVLGGDGFIGSHLVEELVVKRHKITVLDLFYDNKSRNLEHLRDKVTFIPCDYSNHELLYNALLKQDIVYHLISSTNPAVTWNDPKTEINESLNKSIHLFELSIKAGVSKIVFASSGGTIYGSHDYPVDESALPTPSSPYGICKLATELFLKYYGFKHNISFDIYRIGNAYGPRQPFNHNQGVVALWFNQILKNNEIIVYGGQDTLRDYVYIKDIAYLMTHSTIYLEKSDVFNVGTGIAVSTFKLLEIFKKIIDQPFSYRLHPRRLSDNTSIVLNSSKLLKHYPNFTFQVLEDRIHKTWLYYKASYMSENKK